MTRRLKAGDVSTLVGVRGIGGIGKTELAIAAVAALKEHFQERVLWLDCGSNDVIAIQERLAAALGISLDSQDPYIRGDSLKFALTRQQPTLVVLDDLRRRHLADLYAILPPRPPCAVLITSRRRDLPLPNDTVHSLDVLSRREATRLLKRLLPMSLRRDVADEWLNQIAKELEDIPLALKLAGRRAWVIAGRSESREPTSPGELAG